jgi:hypothetical protein
MTVVGAGRVSVPVSPDSLEGPAGVRARGLGELPSRRRTPDRRLAPVRLCPAAIRVPVPKPVREANRCNLEAFEPETPKTPLYVVPAQEVLTLQVVCFGRAHFQLPVRPLKSASRPTPVNGGRHGGPAARPCRGGVPHYQKFWWWPQAGSRAGRRQAGRSGRIG